MPEDEVSTATDKFVGSAAYFVFGSFDGMSANVPSVYRVGSSLGTGGVVCLGTAYWTDKDILGSSAAVKIDSVY